MTRRTWLLALTLGAFGAAGCAGALAAGCVAAPAAAGNILANPGFEDEAGGLPAGWNFDERAKSRGRISVTSRRASGQRALALEPNRSNTDDWQALNVAQGFQIGPLKGKRLELSASLAAEGGATAVFVVYAVDRLGSILGTEQVTSSSANYAAKSAVFDVPADSRAVMLIVACQALGRSGTAYYDNVSVEAVDGARAAAASPDAAGPGDLTADVTVNAGRTIREVPRTVYGQNISWVWGGSMIIDFRTGDFSQELIRLTRDLGPTLLRFPGGSFADFYHWRDGIGPAAQRKETQHQPGEDRSKHTFGTDEALTFAEQTGARLLITVNAHTGTPEEAADWVRYVNGQAAARRVTYWEIGNEFYIKNDHPANAAIPPEEYARRYLAFARAMRRADSSIRLLAIGGENFGRYTSNFFPEWNRKVLTEAGAEMDYLALHNAYFPAVLADQGLTDVRRVYAAMLAAPVLIKENLDTVARQVQTYAPGRNIKLAVTEWGPIFHFDPKSPWVDHVKTLGSALYVASVLKVFVEHPAVDIATAFKLNDVGFMGWIGARYSDHLTRKPADDQYLPTAPYLAFQLFTRHFGPKVVATTVKSPTYDSSAVGMTSAVENVPYLEAVSSVSADGRTLYVIAVNKHFDKPADLRFAFEGFAPSGPATARILHGSGIDANTGTKLPAGVPWARQVEDQRNPRFSKGSPEDVKVTASALQVATPFTFTCPPHAVCALEISGTAASPRRASAEAVGEPRR